MAPKAAGMKKGGSFNSAVLKPNDHVFVSPPWALREGEPYAIARVMEILPPLPPQPSSSSSSAPSKFSKAPNAQRIRVAYFLRPRDISNRYFSDFRLVITTMHSDIVPLSYVRGLCQVKHKDQIEDLDAYKKEKNSFYWNQLYDRYLHRYFDAVPTDKIQNAPAAVTRYLVTHFEFVVCEVGMGLELCDAQKGCAKCFKWASTPESVLCARCKHAFHLRCLEPPLLQKPRIGYSWSCAPCSRAHDEEVEAYMETGIPKKVSTSNGKEKEIVVVAKDKGKGREVVPRMAGSPMRTFQGWPFRYYGMHTDSASVLDPHDSLYPRASTRLGNKFQALVPDWDEERGEQSTSSGVTGRVYFAKKPRVSASKSRKQLDKNAHLERGEDDAVKSIFSPSWITTEDVDPFVAELKKLPTYAVVGVDLINRGLSLLHDGTDTTAALATARKYKQKELGHAVWTVEEKGKLVEAAKRHGNDLEEIADEITTKKLRDIVKRYYIVLGHSMQEDVPQQMEEKVAAATKLERKGSSKAKASTDSDDEGSLCGDPASSAARRARACAVCTAKVSTLWYRCPESIGEETKGNDDHVMCEDCSFRWRNYGVQYPPTTEELKTAKPPIRKAEKGIEPVEVVPEAIKSRSITPLPPPPPPPKKVVLPPKPCVLCKRIEPKSALAQCTNCTLSVHASCFGIGEDVSVKDWFCDLCDSEKKRAVWCSMRGFKQPNCILCPPPVLADPDVHLTALECLKPTEQHHYIHLLCAVWHPEIKFGVPAELRIAEGVSLIPEKRRAQECFICKVQDVGACVKCEDCVKQFHVGCAWNSGYKFAFEIKPLKKKSTAITVKFKEEEGAMSPCIWCPEHRFTTTERLTYDLGQKDPHSRLTALQTYVRAHKSAHTADNFAILRQARHLDSVVSPVLTPPVPIVVDEAPPAPAPAPVPAPVPAPAPTPAPASTQAPAPQLAPVESPDPLPQAPGPRKSKPAPPAPEPESPQAAQPSTSKGAPNPPPASIVKATAKVTLKVSTKSAPKVASTRVILKRSLPPADSSASIATTTPAPLPTSVESRGTPRAGKARPSTSSKKVTQSKAPVPARIQEVAAPAESAPKSHAAISWDALPPLPSLPNALACPAPSTSTNTTAAPATQESVPPPAKKTKLDTTIVRHPPPPRIDAHPPVASSSNLPPSNPGSATRLTPLALDQSNSPLVSGGGPSSSNEGARASPSSSATSSNPRPAAQTKRRISFKPVDGPPPVCANCGTTSSPLFRRDAEGRNICNACGLYFRAHGHHRPSGLASRGGPGEWRIAKRKAQEEGIPISPTIPLPLKKPRAKPRPTRTVRRLAAAAKAAALAGLPPPDPTEAGPSGSSGSSSSVQTPAPPPPPPVEPRIIPRPPQSTFVPRTGVYPSRFSQLPQLPPITPILPVTLPPEPPRKTPSSSSARASPIPIDPLLAPHQAAGLLRSRSVHSQTPPQALVLDPYQLPPPNCEPAPVVPSYIVAGSSGASGGGGGAFMLDPALFE